MRDVNDRTERFELIAESPRDSLVEHATAVLNSEISIRILQEPNPQLVMHQVTEPVEQRPFNLGEILVTTAEVQLDDKKGYAMVPGRARAKAVSGAIVDAAVEANHDRRSAIVADLEAVDATRRQHRRKQWAESRATTIEFGTMGDES